MKTILAIAALLLVSFVHVQEIIPEEIPLYRGKIPGSENWNWAAMFSDVWQTEVVYNVAALKLTAYLPPPRNAGTGVVNCPGGAFHALSINSEGVDVAKWLSSKGVASHNIKVILCSVLPAYDFLLRPGLAPAEKVIALNRMISDFVTKNNFYYLDYFHALGGARNGMRGYSNDEIHPTAEGYAFMESLEHAVADVLKRK